MDNEDTGRHAPAVSEQTGIPKTRPAFGHAALALRDSGHELSRARTAHRNVASPRQAGTAAATVLPDKFSRGRQGWRVRSPPDKPRWSASTYEVRKDWVGDERRAESFPVPVCATGTFSPRVPISLPGSSQVGVLV